MDASGRRTTSQAVGSSWTAAPYSPQILGVLNVSPESMVTESIAIGPEAVRERAAMLVATGADWIDLGGRSITPDAPMIDDAVENDVRRMRMNLAQQGVSLEAYLRSMEASEADLREELRPAARERLRNSLLMRAIAEKEAIAVDDAELDAAIARMAAAAASSSQPEQAAQFAASDYVRTMLQNEMFDRQLTDRLIELATEGRGAVVNGWVAPEPEARADVTAAGEGDEASTGAAEASTEAASEAVADEAETKAEA